ncbi:hypothetical protein RHGRI_023804 [Rhododendron griersonianum]|uniref:Uncharacterized protein n=1 Tax=Rhododendron griersonianum TaxID=479676 RepID=A0AAV6J627_9ERIC|nr:hypothetical protein RHGRI_023804 [Rhododendron griersonianum]
MVVVAMEIGDDGAGDGAFVDLGSSSIHIMYIFQPSLPLLLSGILNFARHMFGSNNRVLIAESGAVPFRDFLPSPAPQPHRVLFSAPIGVKQRYLNPRFLYTVTVPFCNWKLI